MTDRARLGKGLSALIGEYLDPEADAAEVRALPLSGIVPNPLQPRSVFTEEELSDLAASISANGLLQPLVVRPSPTKEGKWELIAGERRFRAVSMLGWTEAPVIVRDASDETLLVLALVENLQREALTALEEAEGYVALTEKFGMSHADIAEAVGKDRSTVANIVRLLNLPPVARRLLQEGQIAPGHARALLSVEDAGKAGELARRAAKEGWSVRETEKRVGATRQKKPRKQPDPDPVVQSLEAVLREHLATRVSVKPSRSGGGTIQIAYHDDTDFERVFELVTGRAATEVAG
ncbi:MAG: ParB/RepB/Spo0J family partition protein [Gemmatimonadota bacterium]|nr:ParB/RepB/Spo0J family partition protein [Gemmatimonadota bacterium]